MKSNNLLTIIIVAGMLISVPVNIMAKGFPGPGTLAALNESSLLVWRTGQSIPQEIALPFDDFYYCRLSGDGKTMLLLRVDWRSETPSPIYIMDMITKEVRETSVKVNTHESGPPDLSFDGSQTVFIKEGHLYIMEVISEQVRQLKSAQEPLLSPKWGPDSKQIAYIQPDNDSQRANLYMIYADDTQNRLVYETNAWAGAPDMFEMQWQAETITIFGDAAPVDGEVIRVSGEKTQVVSAFLDFDKEINSVNHALSPDGQRIFLSQVFEGERGNFAGIWDVTSLKRPHKEFYDSCIWYLNEHFRSVSWSASAVPPSSEFTLNLSFGINLISVPLDPSGISDGNPWRLSELIEFIGSGAKMIIRYDKATKKFVAYKPSFPKNSPANTVVQGGEGYIVVMSEAASVTFTGTAWDGMVSLTKGINLISVPLSPSEQWRLSDLTGFIGKDVTMIIKYDKGSEKFVAYSPSFPKSSPANTVVQGGEGYIVIMRAPATVTSTGEVWENTTTASPPLIASISDRVFTPLFIVEGLISQKGTDAGLNNVKVVVKNLNNRLSNFSITGTLGNDGQYVVAFADILSNRAAQVGDVIEVVAQDLKGEFCGRAVKYKVTANDIQAGKVSLGNLPLLPIPKENVLLQNFPNPFNPETWISFSLGKTENVVIKIYNVQGRLVKTLNLGTKQAGVYIEKDKAAYWDGTNANGERVSSGLYYYVMQAGAFRGTRKMVILK